MKKYILITLALVGTTVLVGQAYKENESNTSSSIDPFKNIMPVRDGGLLYLGQKDLTEQMFLEGIKQIPDINAVNVIVLANNKFETIKKSYFAAFRNLTHLNLSHNDITAIEDKAFEDLPLIEINLSHNKLFGINKKTFDDCEKLKNLDLSFNQITEINKKAFDDCKKLKKLNLIGNPIATKEKIIRALKKKFSRSISVIYKS